MKYEILKEMLEEDRTKFNHTDLYLCLGTSQGIIPHKVLKFSEDYIAVDVPFSATLNNKMKVAENVIQIMTLDSIVQFIRMPEFLGKIIKTSESKIISLSDNPVRPN